MEKVEAKGDAGYDLGVVSINSRVFYVLQFSAVTLLIVLAVLRYVFGTLQGNETLELATRIFDLDRENSVPTWFSMMNLFVASVLLFIITIHCRARKQPLTHYWLVLSILFLGLSAEEVIGLHERVTYFHNVRGSDIKLIRMNAWVVYGSVFAVMIGLYFVPFLLRLERRTAALMVLSGGLFLSGALLSEFLQTLMWDFHPGMRPAGVAAPKTSSTDFLVFLEEGGEMYGVALFNCTIFKEILRLGATLTLRPVPN